MSRIKNRANQPPVHSISDPRKVQAPRTRPSRKAAEAKLINQANEGAHKAQRRRDTNTAAAPQREPTTPEITDRGTVKKAQSYLRRTGFQTDRVAGKWTDNTRKALQEFQASVGREGTGKLDSDSWRKLQRVHQRTRNFPNKLGPGLKGQRVHALQSRLQKLGYNSGDKDGVYDRQVAAAVKQFRAGDRRLEGTSGAIGKGGQERLKEIAKSMNHAPFYRRVKPSQERKLADKRMSRAAARVGREGAQGVGLASKRAREVTTIQQHLRAAGYRPGGVDGIFGTRTEGAVKQFQKRSLLPETGRVDTPTWKRLKKATLETNSPTSPAQQIGERNSRAVERSERLLKNLGFKTGKVDGNYTRKTQEAVDRFRKKNKLKGIGNGVTDHTLKAMKRIEQKQALQGIGKPFKTMGYVRGTPRQIKVAKVDGKLLELGTAKAYMKMKQAASKDGINLHLISGFRTMGEQEYLYRCYKTGSCNNGNVAAPPGYSNHQSGVAVDLNTQGISSSQGTGPVYNWLARNAHKFGFKRIPVEHWHWEHQPGLKLYR